MAMFSFNASEKFVHLFLVYLVILIGCQEQFVFTLILPVRHPFFDLSDIGFCNIWAIVCKRLDLSEVLRDHLKHFINCLDVFEVEGRK